MSLHHCYTCFGMVCGWVYEWPQSCVWTCAMNSAPAYPIHLKYILQCHTDPQRHTNPRWNTHTCYEEHSTRCVLEMFFAEEKRTRVWRMRCTVVVSGVGECMNRLRSPGPALVCPCPLHILHTAHCTLHTAHCPLHTLQTTHSMVLCCVVIVVKKKWEPGSHLLFRI